MTERQHNSVRAESGPNSSYAHPELLQLAILDADGGVEIIAECSHSIMEKIRELAELIGGGRARP